MSLGDKELYEFGPFRLDVSEHTLSRIDGQSNGSLPEKAFQTLCLLVKNQGHLLTKQELLDQIWPESFVEENNVDKCIYAIRNVLAEKSGEQNYIETVRKHGYRFVANVLRVDHNEDRTAEATDVSAGKGRFLNAFEAYQEARIKYQQMTATGTLQARELVSEALRLDPEFALAHILSAELTTLEVIVGLKSPKAGFAEARASMIRAYELGDDSAEFYSADAYIDLITNWDFRSAEQKLREALAINPHHAPANRILGEVYMFQGFHDRAEPYVKRAHVDTSQHNMNILAISHFLARRFREVIEVCDRMLDLSPGHLIPSWTKCWALEQMGLADEAIAGYEKLQQQPNGEPVLRWIGYAYALAGKREKALETANLLEAASIEHNLSPTHIAPIYAALGETTTAVSYIKRGYEMRDPWMLWIATDPRFDALRKDSHFASIVNLVFEKGTPKPGDEILRDILSISDPKLRPKMTESGQHVMLDLSNWKEVVDQRDTKSTSQKPGSAETGARSAMVSSSRTRRTILWLASLAILGFAILTGTLGLRYLQGSSQNSVTGQVSQKRLTVEGGATRVAVSRDGRYAGVAQNAALVLFDLQNGGERILVPAVKDIRIMTIAFHPDGEHVYYGTRQVDSTFVSLYSMPLAGGEPTKIIDEIYGSLSFSPDGRKFAFVRRYPELNEFALLTVNADGSNIDKLATSRLPNSFDGTPAWSPDGNTIACSAINVEGGFHFTLAKVDVATGSVEFVPDGRWKSIGAVSWLADSTRVVIAGQAENSVNTQVWLLDTLTGSTTRITDDLYVYESLSGTRDGRSIVTVKVRQTSHVWMLGDRQTQLTAGFDNHDGFNGLAWAGDGSIFYHSRASGRDAIWRMKSDGSDAKEITPDAAGGFAASLDGRFLVFQDRQSADQLGLQLMDLSDGSLRQLTQNMTALSPAFFPDGKRIVFTMYDKKLSLNEISIDGGQPLPLSNEFRAAMTPVVSPSGKYVAFALNRVQNDNIEAGIGVIDNNTKQMVASHRVKIPTGSQYEKPTLQWSADETEIYFIQLDNSVSNIMRLKLSDGTVSNVTNFADGRIFNFAVEPGGSRMLIARGLVERDALLLQIDQPM